MYVPYVLFRKEKFCPRSLSYDAVHLMEPWFRDDSRSNFRSAPLDHNSAFFSAPRHCIPRTVLIEPIKYSRCVSRKWKNYALYSSLFLASLRPIIRERGSNRRSHIANKIFSRSSKFALSLISLRGITPLTRSIRWQPELNLRLKTFSRCFLETLNLDPPFGVALRRLPFSSSDTLGILKYDSLAHSSSLRRQHCRSQSSARRY